MTAPAGERDPAFQDAPTRSMTAYLFDLPDLQAPFVLEPLAEAYTALVHCLEKRDDAFRSPRSWYYNTLYGSLLMSGQSFGAVCALVGDDAGDRFYPAQAADLARSILEGLGVVLALREAPEARARMYWLDMLWHVQENLRAMESVLTGERIAAWARQQSQQIQQWKRVLQVTPAEWAAVRYWPKPGELVGRGGPYLTGSAAKVWRLFYHGWYGQLSTATHNKGTALIMAIQRHRWRGSQRQFLRQDAVVAATLAHACTVTEICASRPWSSLPLEQLRTVWEKLGSWCEDAKSLYDLRFRDLLDEM